MPDLPPGLRPLPEYVRERQSMTREQFLHAHESPVLIVPVVPQLAVDGDRFSTRKLPVGAAVAPASWAAVKVKKRAGDAFPNFIWVGRETKCDIALPFEGVSKLHGQFIRRSDGQMDLLDTSSANGTFVDGQRLQDNAPVRVRDGTRIRMGALEMTYRTAAGFWEELAVWKVDP
ncbi:MAG TPA: FHA domain-containing protein [Myxococcales bacterium]|jgi:hypothetical protein|nr:FHA domain-containing protein [Myxococcales bacterium]